METPRLCACSACSDDSGDACSACSDDSTNASGGSELEDEIEPEAFRQRWDRIVARTHTHQIATNTPIQFLQTTVTQAVTRGQNVIQLAHTRDHRIGDWICIDNRFGVYEYAQITGFGSVILDRPLKNNYASGAVVRVVGRSEIGQPLRDGAGAVIFNVRGGPRGHQTVDSHDGNASHGGPARTEDNSNEARAATGQTEIAAQVVVRQPHPDVAYAATIHEPAIEDPIAHDPACGTRAPAGLPFLAGHDPGVFRVAADNKRDNDRILYDSPHVPRAALEFARSTDASAVPPEELGPRDMFFISVYRSRCTLVKGYQDIIEHMVRFDQTTIRHMAARPNTSRLNIPAPPVAAPNADASEPVLPTIAESGNRALPK